jgi:hypothetical protein
MYPTTANLHSRFLPRPYHVPKLNEPTNFLGRVFLGTSEALALGRCGSPATLLPSTPAQTNWRLNYYNINSRYPWDRANIALVTTISGTKYHVMIPATELCAVHVHVVNRMYIHTFVLQNYTERSLSVQLTTGDGQKTLENADTNELLAGQSDLFDHRTITVVFNRNRLNQLACIQNDTRYMLSVVRAATGNANWRDEFELCVDNELDDGRVPGPLPVVLLH